MWIHFSLQKSGHFTIQLVKAPIELVVIVITIVVIVVIFLLVVLVVIVLVKLLVLILAETAVDLNYA
jgi:hypothetical protein